MPPVAAEPARQITRPVPKKPKPEIKTVWITTRTPRDGDAGEALCGYYSVADGVVTMRDDEGKATGQSRRLEPCDDPHQIAGRMTREVWLKASGNSDFNRQLDYQRGSFA